ncbi:dihydrofolate reductase [Alkaliflexus imshenetskii]|jgi:dihydrofolate reductase|uniref:dihydrofolate reductase n=1 Tax=Alkaliflexus imshenetskii TaxID=286730 RepID=UPI00047B89B6|nr:dihydrofolate reductase [Alkaliflexus imshenetskii]
MEIAIIVAVDQNNAIGRGGDQLAYISGDLKRFKQLTTGHAIVMGRKTFEALPKGALPNRRNIVVSRNKTLQLPGCEVVQSAEEAIALCNANEKIFVIGGGEIYNLFLPMADTIYFTHIHYAFEGSDTWFPEIDSTVWKDIQVDNKMQDEKSGMLYHYQTVKRVNAQK